MRVSDIAAEQFKTLFPEMQIKGFPAKHHIRELYSFAKKEMVVHKNPKLTTFIHGKMVFRIIDNQIVALRRREKPNDVTECAYIITSHALERFKQRYPRHANAEGGANKNIRLLLNKATKDSTFHDADAKLAKMIEKYGESSEILFYNGIQFIIQGEMLVTVY